MFFPQAVVNDVVNFSKTFFLSASRYIYINSWSLREKILYKLKYPLLARENTLRKKYLFLARENTLREKIPGPCEQKYLTRENTWSLSEKIPGPCVRKYMLLARDYTLQEKKVLVK